MASATAIICKVLQVVASIFRRLNAPELLPTIYGGAQYVDGVKQTTVSHQEVAA